MPRHVFLSARLPLRFHSGTTKPTFHSSGQSSASPSSSARDVRSHISRTMSKTRARRASPPYFKDSATNPSSPGHQLWVCGRGGEPFHNHCRLWHVLPHVLSNYPHVLRDGSKVLLPLLPFSCDVTDAPTTGVAPVPAPKPEVTEEPK
eukprot:1341729-Pyramimonas_sp.AAC.2